MTERKPRDESWEAWANRKLEEALEAGAFDHPEGQGEPLPGIEGPYDPLWWVRRKIEEEGLNVLPPSLSARREAERALEAAFRLADERQFLAALDAVNAFIRRANAVSVWGPPTTLRPLVPSRALALWRETLRGGLAWPEARDRLMP